MLKLFILLICAIPAVTASAQNISFQHDGLDRRYRIHIPDSLPGNSPLVLALHGYGGNNNDMMNNYGWTELADEEGFVVVFPNGTRDPSNNRFWDVDYDFHQGIDIDDDGFLSSLAIHLQNLHGLDPERTFVTGFSNGAEMCFQLACRESETFTAFAPIIGMMLDTLYTNCNPAVVRPILSMNGTSDSVTLYKGDMNNSGGWGAYRPIQETMAFWADIMETPTMTRTFLPNSDPTDGSTVRLDIYTSTEHDRSLWYYLVIGGGHDYPGQWGNMDIDATREVWNFFKLIDPCTDCIVDCNDNGIADSDDIAMGESADINGDLLLDECAWECPGDINRNGITDVDDFSIFLIQFGGSGTADIAGGGASGNGPDGTVDLTDFSAFLVSFGCVVSD